MEAHAVYWRQQGALGRMLVAGPVRNPAGPYGLCVIRLQDGEDPRALWEADPVIRANIGFRVEASPMVAAIVP